MFNLTGFWVTSVITCIAFSPPVFHITLHCFHYHIMLCRTDRIMQQDHVSERSLPPKSCACTTADCTEVKFLTMKHFSKPGLIRNFPWLPSQQVPLKYLNFFEFNRTMTDFWQSSNSFVLELNYVGRWRVHLLWVDTDRRPWPLSTSKITTATGLGKKKKSWLKQCVFQGYKSSLQDHGENPDLNHIQLHLCLFYILDTCCLSHDRNGGLQFLLF